MGQHEGARAVRPANAGRLRLYHCSSVEYFWRVAPNFAHDSEERLLLCIDTDRLDAPVRWEDLEGCGREYPHIYGLVNREAVTAVLPDNKDAQGTWITNPELSSTPHRYKYSVRRQ